MVGVILVSALVVGCVVWVFRAVLDAMRPEIGWGAWLRDCFRLSRREPVADGDVAEDAGRRGALGLGRGAGGGAVTPEEAAGLAAGRLDELGQDGRELREGSHGGARGRGEEPRSGARAWPPAHRRRREPRLRA